MTRRLVFAIIFIAAQLQGTRATAQNVYKCGDSYSQQPCAGGSAIQAADGRTEAQRAQAAAAAKRQGKAADAMGKARLKEEAKAAPAIMLSKPAAARQDKAATPKKPEVFKAVAPAKPGDKPPQKEKKKKKKKAKNAAA